MSKSIILDEMDRVRKEVNKVFKGFLNFPKMSKLKLHMETPKTDIKETKNEFVVKVGMPGMKKTDIDLNVTSKMLEVKAQHRQEVKMQDKGFLKQEQSYKGFYSMFPLPAKVLPDKSKALYTKGVLEIHLPKAHGTIENKIKKLEIK